MQNTENRVLGWLLFLEVQTALYTHNNIGRNTASSPGVDGDQSQASQQEIDRMQEITNYWTDHITNKSWEMDNSQ